MQVKKILAVDFSELFFTSLHACASMSRKGKSMPLEYMVFKKLFSYTKRNPGREVYLLCDGHGSKYWRKEVYPEYKGTRKAQREAVEDLDWPDLFARYAQMVSVIDTFTPMECFREDSLEADDLMAVLAKQGHDLVIFCTDKDLNQLTIYNNVVLVSPKVKKVKDQFVVRQIANPALELKKLIEKGDKSDNIPAARTEAQRIINNKIVNLVQLPEVIEARATAVLAQPRVKNINIGAFCEVYSWDFCGIELTKFVKDYPIQ